MRVEHWDVAMQQGRHVADAMLGDGEPYDIVPYFFSDLADWASLHYVGPPRNWDETIWRGDRDGDEWLALVPARGQGRRVPDLRPRDGPDPRPPADRRGVDVSEHRAEPSDARERPRGDLLGAGISFRSSSVRSGPVARRRLWTEKRWFESIPGASSQRRRVRFPRRFRELFCPAWLRTCVRDA